jgi:hypothetical protein
MSKYISVGSTSVSKEDLSNLSDDEKKDIMNVMFGDDLPGNLQAAVIALGCGIEKDNDGQLVLYTDMKYNSEGEVISFDADEETTIDSSEIENYEEEEQEEEEEMPVTLRTPGADQQVMRND